MRRQQVFCYCEELEQRKEMESEAVRKNKIDTCPKHYISQAMVKVVISKIDGNERRKNERERENEVGRQLETRQEPPAEETLPFLSSNRQLERTMSCHFRIRRVILCYVSKSGLSSVFMPILFYLVTDRDSSH